MPNFNQNYQHAQVPQQPGGYELANQGGIGFWSIVSPLGVVTNLNTLGVKVMGYTGAGMAPVENIVTPYGLLGGSLLQRTVARPKTITLICAVQQENYAYVQRVLQSIINQTAPSNSLQTAQDLKLRFQLLNYQGNAAGTILDTPVVYQGGLEGSVSGLYEERFILAFLDLNPPDTVETTTLQPSLAYLTTVASTVGYTYRTGPSGVWVNVNVGNGPVNALMYDQSGDLWFGNSNTSAKVANRSGSVSQAVSLVATPISTIVSTIHQASDGIVYVGGTFTSPQSYIMQYSGGVFSAVSSNITGPVQDLCSVPQASTASGYYLYAVGSFSMGNGFALWTGTNWGTTGTGPSPAGQAYKILRGRDGFAYIAGAFTSFNGVANTAGLVKINPATGVHTSIGSVAGGAAWVFAIENLPDGRIIIGGDFTSVGGVSCLNAAIYNGTSWSPLGPGLNGQVRSLTVDQATGDVYLFGLFTATGTGTYPITSNAVRWNGSIFIPLDIFSTSIWRSAFRSTDKELAVAVGGTVALSYAGSTALNYAGTADVVPQIKLTGPGQFFYLTNATTKKIITFNNLYLQAGEVATLTMTGGAVSFKSNTPQPDTNITSKILQGSDITLFSIVPGTNNFGAMVTGATGATKIELIYKNTHWGINAGA